MMSKKILVVDDDHDILEALEIILADSGYEVITDSGVEPIDSVKTYKPDLVLMDIMLSGNDGREICKEIKTTDSLKSLPIIMFSAASVNKDEIMKCGSDDFIAKPFDIDDLVSKVEKYS